MPRSASCAVFAACVMEITQLNRFEFETVKPPTKADRLFASSLQGFEIDAIRACRGLQVTMAVNVFGVGTLLPNTLPTRGTTESTGPRTEY